MPDYTPTIGLEVHAELKTRTKMFCDSLNDPDEKHPNVNVCPVCMGHPGTLPTPNKKAIEHVIKVGLATGGKPNPVSKFDRKNYFYPDLPKAYQISQSGQPLVIGGELRGVKINHIHLEEDAGKLMHDDASGATLVDYNRASVPLMELVTEPDIHSAEDAVAFMKELQLTLRYLGVSDADLERGQMRADANISISADGTLGTRAEVKNLNSFNSVFQAINFEIKRQTELLEKGEKVKQETRGWDDAKQKTTSQRSKEEAQDYRYFPEPDIPPFETSVFEPEKLRAMLPELPKQKRKRFMKEYGLDEKQTELLVGEPAMANYFEAAVSELKETLADVKGGAPSASDDKAGVATLYNYLTSDLRGLINQSGAKFEDIKIDPEHLAHLAALIEQKKITSRQAKDMLAKMFETGADPEEIMKSENIGITSDEGEVEAVVLAVIAENQAAVADFKKGKTASLQFLIGKAMAKLKGKARPDMLKDLLERNLA
ncbi:MAG TPA: Asp-tRNA(Asn)/Glu-tRNA(Gln) amidotransferase subunit GatB [Candidatus Paceibacterota bacterium]|nr:Asp-tRNA(Asn)/Glu-tRNA(Gln) amidotransferase subunit GatB [Candidatus Paceibacterota bacterium]